MKTSLFAAILLTAVAPHISGAAELQPGTLMAWNAYLKQADLHMQERTAKHARFLWTDESPDRAARVRSGEVVIAPVTGHGAESVPHGLIHDWIGAIFIPGATIDSLLTVLHDYDKYQQIYRPVVVSSGTLACTDTSQEFQMVWEGKALFIKATMQGRYHAHDVRLDGRHGYSVAEAVEVREIERYGEAGERLLPPDTGHGFVWRIRSMARFAERDGGVYLELEAIALTRDIPPTVDWMVNPVVNRLSVNSLTMTLRQTRSAVISSRGALETASCPNPRRAVISRESGSEESR